jgi:hypothetical protein
MIVLLPSAQTIGDIKAQQWRDAQFRFTSRRPCASERREAKKKKKKIESCRVALWSRGSNSKYVAVILMFI